MVSANPLSIAVVLAPDGRLDPRFCQPFGVANADVFRPPVGVAYQASITLRLSGILGLLQRIEHEIRCSELLTRQPAMRPRTRR